MLSNDVALVDSCIQDGDLSKLLTLPKVIDDFSETSIVKCVECFLKASDEAIRKSTNLTQKTLTKSLPWSTECEAFSPAKCYALNIMLQQKFSPQFLQEATRIMSFDCVLALTKYLHFLLCWVPFGENSNKTSPSYEQIIDWLTALLDSHYQQLHLADDASAILTSILQHISNMAKSQVEWKALQGTLKELIQQFEKQQKNSKMGNYCIEVISF